MGSDFAVPNGKGTPGGAGFQAGPRPRSEPKRPTDGHVNSIGQRQREPPLLVRTPWAGRVGASRGGGGRVHEASPVVGLNAAQANQNASCDGSRFR